MMKTPKSPMSPAYSSTDACGQYYSNEGCISSSMCLQDSPVEDPNISDIRVVVDYHFFKSQLT